MTNEPNWIGRLSRNAEAWRYILDHPFTGLGLGQVTMEAGSNLPFWTYNPYLHWGAAMGIPAMLAFATMMLLSLFHSIRNYLSEKPELKAYQLGILIALLIWLINQFTTGDSLTYFQPVESILFFYAVIGMILGQRLARETESSGVVV
jgi:O-antigen ligase